MNTLDALKSRRSCRSYRDEQIDDAALNSILEAGMYAPSGMGKQSPVMVAVQDKALIKKLSAMNAAVMNTDNDPFYGAPTVVIVFADKNCGTYLEDGSLCMGNMLNAAHALGVDSCWIHRAKEVFATEEGKALMAQWELGENYVGIGNCILGYGTEGGIREARPRKEDYAVIIK